MALYRAWRSEADVIESVSLTFGIDAVEWKAVLASDKQDVPLGVILDSGGKTFSILRG